jgi:hypothetical protein
VSARRALLLAAAATLAACPPPPSQSSAPPDPRLGVVVHEDDAVSAGFSRNALAVDAQGNRYVLLSVEAGRVFAETTSAPLRSHFFRVSTDGAVSALPAPALGRALGDTGLVLGDDGTSLLLVEFDPSPRGDGVLLRAQPFVDGAWRSPRTFTRADLPTGVRPTWDARADQLRFLGGDALVVRHDGRLHRHDGASWVAVATPEPSTEVLLGPGDAAGVRVLWLTAAQRLESDVLKTDGTWAGQRVGTSAPLQASFARAAQNGVPDDFVLQLATGGFMTVLRLRNGLFERLGARPPLAREGEVDGPRFVRTRSPRRAVLRRGDTLEAWLDGFPAGPLGTLHGGAARDVPVTCDTDCRIDEQHPVGDAEACRRCVPRTVRVGDYAFPGDASAVHLLLIDWQQDVRRRITLKAFALPGAPADLTASSEPTGAWPEAVDAGVGSDWFFVTGVALRPAEADHGGTTVSLFVDGVEQGSTQTTDAGVFQLDPARGQSARLVLEHPDAGRVELELPDAGEAQARVVFAPGARGAWPELLDSEFLTTRDWNIVINDAGIFIDPIAGGAGGGDWGDARPGEVRFLHGSPERLALFTPATGLVRSVTGVAIAPGSHVASLRPSSRGVYSATAAPDGDTELDWRLSVPGSTTPTPAGRWVDLEQAGQQGCAHTLLWRRAGPGDVRLNVAGCSSLSVDSARETSGPAPILRHVEAGASGLYGFEGAGCGPEGEWAVACPLHQVVVPGTSVPRATVTSLAPEAYAVLTTGFGTWWLARDGAGQALVHQSGAGVVTTVHAGLPAPLTAGNPGRPLFTLPNGRAFARAGSELYELLGATASATLLFPRVVAAVPVPNFPNQPIVSRLLVVQGPEGAVGCGAKACTAWLVDGAAAPARLFDGATGNERVMPQGVFTDGRTMSCPDGSTCAVLDSVTWAGARVAAGVGRLSPDLGTPSPLPGVSRQRVGDGALLDFPSRPVHLRVATP